MFPTRGQGERKGGGKTLPGVGDKKKLNEEHF